MKKAHVFRLMLGLGVLGIVFPILYITFKAVASIVFLATVFILAYLIGWLIYKEDND